MSKPISRQTYAACEVCGKAKPRTICRRCGSCGAKARERVSTQVPYSQCQVCGQPKSRNRFALCQACSMQQRGGKHTYHTQCVSCGQPKPRNKSTQCQKCSGHTLVDVGQRQAVITLYREVGENAAEVGRRLGISRERVRQLLKMQHTPTRRERKKCPRCGTSTRNSALCTNCVAQLRVARYEQSKRPCPKCGARTGNLITAKSHQCQACRREEWGHTSAQAPHHQLWVERYEGGETVPAIARDCGVTSGAVYALLLRRGVVIRERGWSLRVLTPAQRVEAVRRYTEDLVGSTTIARELGVSASTIYGLMVAAGVNRPQRGKE